MQEDSKTEREIVVNPLVYFQKPTIGQDVVPDGGRTPVQLIFPSGGFGLGMPVKGDVEAGARGPEQTVNENDDGGVLASAPMHGALDRRQVVEYKTAFCALALVNFVLTCLLYFEAHLIDPSRVQAGTAHLPTAFDEVPRSRRPVEAVDFAFLLVLLVLGTAAAVKEAPTGLSAFALGLLLNFFLSTAALPHFVFSLRYLLDLALLYVALVLRSRLVVTFLVLNPHRF